MTKTDLITVVARETSMSTMTVKTLLEMALATIAKTARTEKVVLKGFGTFAVKSTPARPGRNPKTGEAVAIPARQRFTFKASKQA